MVVALTYTIKAVFRPSKIEVNVLSRILTFVVLFLVDIIKKWYTKHPRVISARIDKLYAHVFHSKHYFKAEENGRMNVG